MYNNYILIRKKERKKKERKEKAYHIKGLGEWLKV
jgi:hypothetical protein